MDFAHKLLKTPKGMSNIMSEEKEPLTTSAGAPIDTKTNR